MTKEAKIGLVSIISLALLYFGINYLKGINLFKPVNHYFVTFHNVKDVTVSSPVYIDGFKVGLVRSIVYDYENTDKITVEISLDDEMKLTTGSYITIIKTLLSGGELHIHLNKYVKDYLKPESHFNLIKLISLPDALNARLINALASKPAMDYDICVGCGECARCCPPKAIDMSSGKPVIDTKRCIKCFCCQELCPKKAVKIKRPLLNRFMIKFLK